MQTINIDGASPQVQKVIEILGNQFLGELNTILLNFYHMLANDSLTLDDLDSVGKQYGLDLEETYFEMFMNGDGTNEMED